MNNTTQLIVSGQAFRLEYHGTATPFISAPDELSVRINAICFDLYKAHGMHPTGKSLRDIEAAQERFRCVEVMIRAMFNWNQQGDIGAIGFQMQMLYSIINPQEAAQGFDLHTLAKMAAIFRDGLACWAMHCEGLRKARINELRAKRNLPPI